MCVSLPKFSEPLPETHLFFYLAFVRVGTILKLYVHDQQSRYRGQKYSNIALVQQDLQFSLVLQTHSPSFKRICNNEHKEVICNMTSLSNSSQSTCPTGQEMLGELLVLSRFHS